MSTKTTNLQLEKPDSQDNVDVSVLNANYDIIDEFSGNINYENNLNKPLINSVELIGNKTASELGFATVSTTGAYSDLTGKPTIPTKTSDLTNDSNYVSDSAYVHTDENYSSEDKVKLTGIDVGANNYVLPTATTTVLGGVKVDGTSITIDNGVISAIGGGGGSSTLSGLIDVEIENPKNGDTLIYDNSTQTWINKPSSVEPANIKYHIYSHSTGGSDASIYVRYLLNDALVSIDDLQYRNYSGENWKVYDDLKIHYNNNSYNWEIILLNKFVDHDIDETISWEYDYEQDITLILDNSSEKILGNMDYIGETINLPAPDIIGKTVTIKEDGDYILEKKYYYVQKSWNIISKYDSLDFSGEPLAVFDCNSSYDGVNIDDIFTMDRYEYVKALVNGYAVYDRDGIKIMDLPVGVDRAHKLGFGSYITTSSSTTRLSKGDTVICDGSKWIVQHTSYNEHAKNTLISVGYWGAELCYHGCFEYDSETWNGSKSFTISDYISGYDSSKVSKIIDYSVILETNSGKYIKTSMVGSGMDTSAYLSDKNTLTVYSSEQIVRLIFCVEFAV